MSKDKSDNSGPSNFISDFISSIGRAVCESTKESYGDKCPHDVNVGEMFIIPAANQNQMLEVLNINSKFLKIYNYKLLKIFRKPN